MEAAHTTEEAKAYAAQVVELNAEITELTESAESAESDGVVDDDVAARIQALTDQAVEARRSELKAIEWKPLWGKPAVFALVVMVIFLALFKQTAPKKTEPTSA